MQKACKHPIAYTYIGKQHLHQVSVKASGQAFHRILLPCTVHNCRNKLLNKSQEEFDKRAAATEAAELDCEAPLTPVHKGALSEQPALQAAAQAAAVARKVCPHLTIMCC